jgi:hypothetical protein
VKSEIDKWDPVELLAIHAPSNEYEREVDTIYDKISGILNIEQIQKIIYDVFLERFTSTVFLKNYVECFDVASNIYHNLYKESFFSIKDFEEIGNICFHDAELRLIITDYYKHKVECPLVIYPIGQKSFHALLRFIDIVHIDVDIFEPWGSGFYINDVDFKPNKNDSVIVFDRIDEGYFTFKILLNSGDWISVIAKQLIYIEEIYK